MKKTIYLTILTIVTVVCIIFGALYHIGGFFSNITFFNFLGGNLDRSPINYSEDLDAFEAINLDTNVMDITIERGEGYHLSYNCEKYLEPEFEVKNNTFTLSQPDVSSPVFNISSNKCSMTLTVPSDVYFTKIDITSDVGAVSIEDIGAKTAIFQADVGDLTLDTCAFSDTNITADVGDITSLNTDLGNATISADVGDIELNDATFESLDLSNDVGDVDLDCATKLSNYQIELSTDVGDVTVNGKNHDKDYSRDGNGEKLTIENSTGDINLNY